MNTPPDRRVDRDRRVARHYRFDDRRTGFDRRKRTPILSTLRDSRWALIALLVLLNALSLLDGLLTALELWSGVAREGNPVFGGLIAANPLLAGGLKIAIMFAVSVLIWHWRKRRAILVVALAAFAMYSMLLAYHLVSITRLFG